MLIIVEKRAATLSPGCVLWLWWLSFIGIILVVRKCAKLLQLSVKAAQLPVLVVGSISTEKVINLILLKTYIYNLYISICRYILDLCLDSGVTIPGDVEGQTGCGTQCQGLVDRAVISHRLDWSQRSFPASQILWYMLMNTRMPSLWFLQGALFHRHAVEVSPYTC